MAGGEHQIIDLGGMKVDFFAQPASMWRHIPLFGQWRMFRLGQRLPFVISGKVLQTTNQAIDHPVNIRLRVIVNGQLSEEDLLEFSFKGEVGETIQQKTDPFFLRPSGDAVLTGMQPGPRIPDLYVFHVEETAYRAAAVVAAAITGLGGIALGAFLTWLITKGGPSSP